jgi:prepilin-type processing-associated H-X9-DG protein/prepilin-type N-terminal cleavage/methylation domain-containing protein
MIVKKRQFTLLELLVVIGIIGIIAAILVPVIAKARSAAKRTVCIGNLKQVSLAMSMYLGENSDIMPNAAQLPSLELNDNPRIVDVLASYTGAPEVFLCPEDVDEIYFQKEGSSYEYSGMIAGRKVSQSFLSKRWGEENIPIMYDYKPFHGDPGAPGAANYLFADGHVGDLL